MKNKTNKSKKKTPQIKIEKNVPTPTSRKRGKWSLLLDKMNKGDSVVVPANRRMHIVLSAKYHGQSVVTRKVDNDSVRVWKA